MRVATIRSGQMGNWTTVRWLFACTTVVTIAAANAAPPPPRLGPPQCTRQVVKSGDTALGIARKVGVPWAQFVQLNAYIPDLNKIWPLDELTLWCPPPPEIPKPTLAVVAAVVPSTTVVVPVTTKPTPPTTTVAELVTAAMDAPSDGQRVECNPTGRQRWDGSEQCVTPLNVIAEYLRAAGFDGDALVLMLAITLGESSGDPYSHGDRHITDDKWGDSVGWFQVRTVHAQKGSGGPRDVDALLDPRHQADAAWRISAGGTNFVPWGAYTNGSYKKFLDRARKAVQ